MPPIEGLGEEYSDNETLQRFNTVDDLAKSFVETKAMVGNSVRIPTADAGEEARTEFQNQILEKAPNLMLKPNFDNKEQSRQFYETLGMPQTSDQYEAPTLNVPDGVHVETAAMERMKGIAHKHGLTKAQYEGVVSDYMTGEIDSAKLNVDKESADTAALKDKWGMAHADRMDIVAATAAATNAPEIVLKAAKDGTLSGEMSEWLHGISTQIGDEGVNFHRQNMSSMVLTPGEASQQLADIMGNKEHAYFDPQSSGNQEAIKKVVKLNAIIAGEKFDEVEYDKRMNAGR